MGTTGITIIIIPSFHNFGPTKSKGKKPTLNANFLSLKFHSFPLKPLQHNVEGQKGMRNLSFIIAL